MIETRGAGCWLTRWVSFPLLSRDTSRGSGGLRQCKRSAPSTARSRQSPDSTPVRLPVVPQRSARRATARRASSRRATARRRKDDVEGRIVEYLKDHPQSTTGDIAKGLNADRGTIAAGLSHIVRASDDHQGPGGRVVMAETLGHRGTPRRAPRGRRSGRRSPPRWTTARCEANASRRRSSRAARRARSTCPPTTAARAATASRGGPRAAPPRMYTFLYRV